MQANLNSDLIVKNLIPKSKPYYCMSNNKNERGFGVIIYPSGTKTFVYKYKLDCNQKMMTLGEYPTLSLKDARNEFLKNSIKVKDLRRGKADGVDPVEVIRAKREGRTKANTDRENAPSVRELILDYLTRYVEPEKPKSAPEYRRILEKELCPWFNRKIMDIKDSDIESLTDSIIDRGSPGMARNTHQVVRAMFNWARRRTLYKRFLPVSPCAGLGLPVKPRKRKRSLKPDEIKLLWENLDKCMMSEHVKIIIKMALFTAQRSGEICGIHTREISDDWWTIPAERAKNGNPHRVFLCPTTKELINHAITVTKRLREISPELEYEGYIFPCPHWRLNKNKPIDRHAVSIAVARNFHMQIIDDKGKPMKDKNNKPITESRFGFDEPFVPHDLRRTSAGLMAWAGVQHEDRERVLNHTLGELDETYVQHDFDERKKDALLKLELKLADIVALRMLKTDNNVQVT